LSARHYFCSAFITITLVLVSSCVLFIDIAELDDSVTDVGMPPCTSNNFEFDLTPISDDAFRPVVLSVPRIQAAHDIDIRDDGIAATVSKGRNHMGEETEGLGTLAVIDLSDPTNPTILSHIDGFHDAQTVEIYGDIVHVGDNRGVHVYDIKNPRTPKKIHFVNLTQIPRTINKLYSITDVEINGWKSYKGKKFIASKRGFIIVLDETDIRRPFLPSTDWAIKVGGSPHDIDILDDVVLIASRPSPDWPQGLLGSFYLEAFLSFDTGGKFILPSEWKRIGGIRTEGNANVLTGANRIRSVNCRTYVSTKNTADSVPPGEPSFFRVYQNNRYIDMTLLDEVKNPAASCGAFICRSGVDLDAAV